MEPLLKFLPSAGQPIAVRYGATILLVAVFYLFSLAAGTTQGPYPYLMIGPVVLASILFDRGSGFLATALGAVAAASIMDWRVKVVGVLAVLTLFVILALFLTIFCESLRKTLERGVAAQQELQLMLTEERHRVKNDLALLSSMIALQARSQSSPAIRAILESAAGRVHVVAEGQEHFRFAAGDPAINMQRYLEAVCWRLGEALRDVRPIALRVDCEEVILDAPAAIRIGLTVNELVTNALKHAFPGDRGGTIQVRLLQRPTHLALIVEDDGAGYPEDTKTGLGSRILMLLTQQSGGTVEHESANPGCRVVITIPRDGTE